MAHRAEHQAGPRAGGAFEGPGMHIAPASADQLDSLLDLMCEINRYYNPSSPASRGVVLEHLRDNLLAVSAPHRLVAASRDDGSVIGMVAVALVYSFVEPEVQRRRQCQIKELFVTEAERGGGAGRALMAWVARYALENGCHRIDWPVQASNPAGIAFYVGLGARRVEDRLGYRLSEPALSALAGRSGAYERI
jgi:GNAT superfamily N-acetyltransferase